MNEEIERKAEIERLQAEIERLKARIREIEREREIIRIQKAYLVIELLVLLYYRGRR
jgi:prefoldin subunit 5